MENNLGVRKKVNVTLIGLIVAGCLAVLFLILFIVQMSQNAELRDKLSKAETEIAQYVAKQEEVEKKVLKSNTTKKKETRKISKIKMRMNSEI